MHRCACICICMSVEARRNPQGLLFIRAFCLDTIRLVFLIHRHRHLVTY